MSNAFAPIVRARPIPIFGRPVHQGSPPIDYSPILLLKPFGFRIAPDTLSSDENLVGQRGITPAFGYSAPHPSAGGTLTLLIHALPSAHYTPVRLLQSVHRRRQPLRPSRRGPARRHAARPNRRSPRACPGESRGSDAILCSVMWSPTPPERQRLTWRCRTCCLRRCLPSRPLRASRFRGSIAHPTASLCTLHSRRRRRPCNTRYRVPATAYPRRSSTGWTAPASWRTS